MITINVSAAKKLPHPTEQFGSIQAIVSLQGEAGTLADAPSVMRDLFQVAQASVDQHLAKQVGAGQVPVAASNTRPSPVQQSTSSQPIRNTSQRRGPAPVTDSQLRFIDRLIQQTGCSVPSILQRHQVGSLRDLTCKTAAGLIDELKGQTQA